MTATSQPDLNPEPKPNSSKRNTHRKREVSEKLLKDYPSFTRLTKNPLSGNRNLLTHRGEVLVKLGVTEDQLGKVPKIRDKVTAGWGSVAEAISILEGDDDPDSIRFMEKWNLLTDRDRIEVQLEDVLIASGLTARRFIELLAGATVDHDEFVAKIYKSRKKMKVLESAVKAATDEVPILDKDGEVIGTSNGDVKAMELFFKLTGDIKPSGGVVVNQTNQTANVNTPPTETRPPLQKMDTWLMELEDVRKPKQLGVSSEPVIPVEMPDRVPEIEYLGIED